ncbi:MAG TPA: glycosyltransferase [Thermoanaerobaculia bacterium]|nr:glycosyltransferase [Thermoanaerobaculia bacterium]
MLSVVLPTRNEREGVEILVHALASILERPTAGEVELLVVDDSTDGSDRYLAERFAPLAGRVRFEHRARGTGLGTAIGDGIEMAAHPLVAVMDADFNHDPLDVPRLLARFSDGVDLAGGSRFLPGGGMPGHALRCLGSRLFNRFVRTALSLPTTDHLGGFWVAERGRILELKRRWDLFHGYGDYYIRLLFAAHLLGWRVAELPVRYLQRLRGESKTSFRRELVRYSRAVGQLRREREALAGRLAA